MFQHKSLAAFTFKGNANCSVETILGEREALQMAKPSSGSYSYSGGPFSLSSGTTMRMLHDGNESWGIQFTYPDQFWDILQFRQPVSLSAIQNLKQVNFELHCTLGGDIQFLNLVLGLQCCSSPASSRPHYYRSGCLARRRGRRDRPIKQR